MRTSPYSPKELADALAWAKRLSLQGVPSGTQGRALYKALKATGPNWRRDAWGPARPRLNKAGA